MKWRLPAAVGGACVLAVGCADIFGLGSYTQADASASEGGVLCVPELPSGWTFVSYARDPATACASGFGSSAKVQEGPFGPASCACSCAASPPSCATLSINAGATSSTCTDSVVGQIERAPVDGGCVTLSNSINTGGGDGIAVTPLPDGGGCTATATIDAGGPAFSGTTCGLTSTTGGGCAGGVSVPNPSPAALCIRQSGIVPCPTGYPVAHMIGTTIADTRGCSACTCGFDGGCGGSVTFNDNSNCGGGNNQVVPATGVCTSATGHNWQGLKYVATVTAACAPSMPTPTGDAGFSDPATVCCVQ